MLGLVVVVRTHTVQAVIVLLFIVHGSIERMFCDSDDGILQYIRVY